MNRTDYLARVASRLRFLNDDERHEVLSDMHELYDGLAASGLSDAEVQVRIGSPEAVAGEYRLEEQLDRVDRSPGATSGLRIGLAALTGRFARGLAVQLIGLVWISLAILVPGIVVVGIAGLALATAAAAGYEPVVTTLAVPGIPVISGVLLGLAVAMAAVALLFANRLAMQRLSRLMRERLRRSASGPGAPLSSDHERPVARRVDSGRAVAWAAGAAGIVAVGAALLMLVVPAPRFPLIIDRLEAIDLPGEAGIDVHVLGMGVRFVVGAEPTVRLTARLRQTFAQSVNLRVIPGGETVLVEAVYHEGLSWGINPSPMLTVTLPGEPARVRSVTVRIADAADVDLSALPAQLRGLVRRESQ